MKKFLGLFMLVLSIVACTSQSGHRIPKSSEKTMRAKILKTGVITYCTLNNTEKSVYRALDTVNIDVSTHKIVTSGLDVPTLVILYETQQPIAVNYFTEGQVIYPDYACPDTLIVRNAMGLNKAMAWIEQGIIDADDASINEIFQLYCDYYLGSYQDQYAKLKVLKPQWDSMEVDQAIQKD
jgi:hypothetical protein